MYTLVFLKNGKRNMPVQDFLANLEKSKSKRNQALLQKFQRDLELLACNGLNIKPPAMRKMVCRKGLYKYRIGRFRIMFTILDDAIILLHLFEKHTQKTPERDKIIGMRNMDIALTTFAGQ